MRRSSVRRRRSVGAFGHPRTLTAMALAAAGTAKSAAMAARRVIAEPSASICGEAARCGAAAGAKAAAGEKADAVAQRPSEAMERSPIVISILLSIFHCPTVLTHHL